MNSRPHHLPSTSFENTNIKIKIGHLLFNIALDHCFFPTLLETEPGKHNHIAFEIHFYVSGSGTLFVEQQEVKIEPNSIHFIGPNVYHSIKHNKDDPITRFYIQFTYQETRERESYFPPSETKQMTSILTDVKYFQFTETSLLQQLVDEVKREFSQQSLGYYSSIQSLFMLMIVQMTRCMRPDADKYTLPDKVKDEQRDRIIDLFFNNYRDNLTIENLAVQLSLSKKQTNRILLKYYSATFKQRLLDIRVEESKDLLLNTGLPIQKVAEKIGYANFRNFVQIFKKRTGCTPAQFRRENRHPD